MKGLRELYRIGHGPSSSHTMGPYFAAERFRARKGAAHAARFEVELRGSLSATGRGHFTDRAVQYVLGAERTSIVWNDDSLPAHPNGMIFRAFDAEGKLLDTWTVYSVGGGALSETGKQEETPEVYPYANMAEIIRHCREEGIPLWKVVEDCEGVAIWDHLEGVRQMMMQTIDRGLDTTGVLPGGLKLPRRARELYLKSRVLRGDLQRTGMIAAYAHAANEENAALGLMVTAPTCGASGTLPAVLRWIQEQNGDSNFEICRALAVAGLFGNVAKQNGSISGAEAGCQAEVGVACAMASAAAAYLFGASVGQIEMAAEMGLEHFLGLTCDPVKGLVQIPCIERNAVAATRAIVSAELAHLSDGRHVVSYDAVVAAMLQTGHDLPSLYRETSKGGLCKVV